MTDARLEQAKDNLRRSDSHVAAFDPSSIPPSTVVSRTPTIQGDYDGIRQSQYSESGDNTGTSTPQYHVDIEGAKREFAKLERVLTQNSLRDEKRDVEKNDQEGPFNLREYFQTTHDAHTANGVRHKHVGVVWEDLTVEVPDTGSKFFVRSLPHAIWGTLSYPIFYPLSYLQRKFGKSQTTRPILQNFDGVLKPGEICLVLGVPGSGCTTFLKVIANQRGAYAKVTGDVKYAGIESEEMAQKYGGEFALDTKTPGKRTRLPGVTGKAFNEQVLNTLLKMLNITHTKKTLVGNAFVRGVSGGERKRVSILEMMATRAHVVSYDNSTKGLDASTALDFVKGLRVATDVLGQTTFVSLYQAGENIYNLVDKVLVIDQGRTVYFGPAKDARSYFVSLGFMDRPREATADYLTACTDPNERQSQPGANPPGSPEELEAAFRSSKYYQAMVDEREEYRMRIAKEDNREQQDFRTAVVEAKKSNVSTKSPYTLGLLAQVWILTKRQFYLQLQDRFELFTSFGIAIGVAIVVGATYLNLPATTSGGFTRGSVMLTAMIMACWQAFGEMPTQVVGRPIFLKQTGYKLFRPGALSIANTLADMPFSAVRFFLFNVIVYFMTGLRRTAGAFFTFHIFIYLEFLTMQGFFRTIGVVCPNFDSAFRLASFLLPNLFSYAGYFIPVDSMRRYLFWVYYIDPLGYTFSGLMENEFGKLDMLCAGKDITPRNAPGQDFYPEQLGPNQVCTFFGAQPGQTVVHGKDYIDVGFQLASSDLWKRNFVVLVALFIVFQVTQYVAMEKVHWGGMGGAQIFVKEDKETKALNERLQQRSAQGSEKVGKEATFQRGKTLTWKDVNYVVPVPGGTRRLLHDVTGYVKSGQLVALMGASGAGKTTALDVLAQRKNIGVISGEILLEGRPLSTSFARETAYAEQMDVHEPTTTVREAMRFSAYLRQPYDVSKEEKDEYVESIIELLELQELSEALVLTLSVEARKRLTIGVELASRPKALLFLDEPTSGLDAQSAFNIVRFLRKLAAAGQSIICTIHQPSPLLFENFDRLLLLERGGETVYFGDIGPDSRDLREYLSRNGAHCPDDQNPAEFMLEAIGAGSRPRIGPRDWKDIWLESPEFAKLKREIEELKAESVSKSTEEATKPSTYATPILYQLQVVVKRSLLSLWRSPDYTWTRLFVHIFLSLFISLAFLNLGLSVRDLQYRVFAIFWATLLPSFIFYQIVPAFIINRMLFIREASSKMYSPVVFAIGQILAETPWSIGLGQGSSGQAGSGYYLLMLIAIEFFGVTLAQAVAALSPNVTFAVITNMPLTIILFTFAGVVIPYPNMAKFWRSWLYELSPFTRMVAGLVATELHGLPVNCRDDEYAIFEPPTGQTCGAWASTFVDSFGGYLKDANATSHCQYCQVQVGDEYLKGLNMDYGNRWRDLGIVFAFFGFNVLVTIIASRYLRYARR
ncbi:hypothetical protein FS837_010988 [Tulasnella sp. UAMH 9824]|nr:hypothetical protein FS837_010988 [Tulasnella sp. UAMH 9824]